jgi:TRAP-type C4-dicarboxylate transport system substrate-binding protein
MIPKFNRRKALSAVAALGLMAGVGGSAIAQDLVQLRLSMAGSETDQRSVAMAEVFGPAVSEFASYEPSYNATLFAQGTELEAISRGNLEMSIASAQELAQFFPEFSIFAPRATCIRTPPTRSRSSTTR